MRPSFFNPAVILILAAALVPGTAPAGTLATVGPVYEIIEEDLLAHIERRLRELERDGSLARLDNEMRARAEKKLAAPPPAEGVRTTTVPRSYWFDPSITLPQPITTPEGRVLAAAGTRVNPLDTRAWSGRLLFLDGRDPRQRAFAPKHLGDGKTKPVLIAGDFRPLSRDWKIPVFYDQGGELTRRFGIRHVPALVYQDGKRLRIDELLPE